MMIASRPRIGITTCNRPADDQFAPSVSVNWRYAEAVYAAGGLPLLLPNLPPDAADETLSALDGLLLSGGGDLDAALWGEALHPAANPPDPLRDACELALARAAIARDLPLFGICRGVQTLAVALGGTLWQDIPSQFPGALPHRQTAPRTEPSHTVIVTPGSRLAQVLFPDAPSATHPPLNVNSFHHQAPREAGTLLAIDATSPDGLIESLSLVGARFVIGVQWHPEEMAACHPQQARVFQAFVQAAAGVSLR